MNFTPRFLAFRPMRAQKGLTLIELLVAMTLGLLIVLAASAALLVSRQGFFAVDAASQLRDNARYAQDIVQRVGVQAGYKNIFFMQIAGGSSNPEPHVFGINNAKRSTNQIWSQSAAWGTNDVGKNSDILVIRAQASTASQLSTTADETIVDCLGTAVTAVPVDADDRFISILHVLESTGGEPALMCSRPAASGSGYDMQPLVQGVESFQVLYGVDNVVPNTAPAGSTDSVPNRYLRADQLTVGTDPIATYANWRRVRSLRIGMVLRSPPGSAVDASSQQYYPLGAGRRAGSSSNALGTAFGDASSDPGTIYSAADRRLRQTVTFTVHLRNFQDLETN